MYKCNVEETAKRLGFDPNTVVVTPYTEYSWIGLEEGTKYILPCGCFVLNRTTTLDSTAIWSFRHVCETHKIDNLPICWEEVTETPACSCSCQKTAVNQTN